MEATTKTTKSTRLPIGYFYAQHLGTPTAGMGTAELLAKIRARRVEMPTGSWGWAQWAASNKNRKAPISLR